MSGPAPGPTIVNVSAGLGATPGPRGQHQSPSIPAPTLTSQHPTEPSAKERIVSIPARPASDAAYLDNAARIIFMGGLNRQVVDNKWPAMREAFRNFEPAVVADFSPADIDRLAEDERLIRYRAKLNAVVKNAGEIADRSEEAGSFDAWVDALVAERGVDGGSKELSKRFSYISEKGAHFWLYSCGHDIGDYCADSREKYEPLPGLAAAG